MLYIKNVTLYTPDTHLSHGAVLVEKNRIKAVGSVEQIKQPEQATVIEATDLILAPGFIDLQLNGAFGNDFTNQPASMWPVSAKLTQFGITSYLPTLVTSPLKRIKTAQTELLTNKPDDYQGATPLGLHVEGPFLNLQKKGAHNPAYLRLPRVADIAEWSRKKGVWLVTLAPELPDALILIKTLVEQDVVVSAGHSIATYQEAVAGINQGIRYGTHLFNAMAPLGHREPGLPGALLANQQAVVGLIADGVHIHPEMINLIWSIKGCKGVNLVSDGMAALGMPPGNYKLNDLEVTVTTTDCRLADGTLAGTIQPINKAIRNLISYTNCSLNEAFATVTTTPAYLLGIGHDRGRIAVGYIADMVLLNQQLEVISTIVAGEVVYQTNNHKI